MSRRLYQSSPGVLTQWWSKDRETLSVEEQDEGLDLLREAADYIDNPFVRHVWGHNITFAVYQAEHLEEQLEIRREIMYHDLVDMSVVKPRGYWQAVDIKKRQAAKKTHIRLLLCPPCLDCPSR